MNEKLKEKGMPPAKVPNLDPLNKAEPGTHRELESSLHKCVIDFLIFLNYPTSHKQHLETRLTYLPWLVKDHFKFLIIWEQAHHILRTEGKGKNAKHAKTFAWKCYIDTVFHPYTTAIETHAWPNFLACEAEDICMLCAIQSRPALKSTCSLLENLSRRNHVAAKATSLTYL